MGGKKRKECLLCCDKCKSLTIVDIISWLSLGKAVFEVSR